MGWWLGLFVSREGSASCRFKDAFSIFKILTGCRVLLISRQLFIKHAISFPLQCLFWVGECLKGVLALDFWAISPVRHLYCDLRL